MATNQTKSFLSRLSNPFGPADMSAIFKGRIKDELPEVIPFLTRWANKSGNLRFLQILLGFLSTFFSILTTTVLSVQGIDSYYSKYFAFIAAVSIGLMTAFDLGTKSNNMTKAWRHLIAVVIKFNQKLCEKDAVIDAYIESEHIIGDVTFQQQGLRQDQGIGANKNIISSGEIICRYCGKIRPISLEFCPRCGRGTQSKSEDMKRCVNCNATVVKDSLFCSSCGKEFAPSSPSN
jgi:RNA polymerase subunit RPABC4/transcription elongation factor Spt4